MDGARDGAGASGLVGGAVSLPLLWPCPCFDNAVQEKILSALDCHGFHVSPILSGTSGCH